MDAVPFECCAAKSTEAGQPGTTVLDHCRNVGHVAESLRALALPSVDCTLPPGVGLVAALHDVGKVSPGFQLKYFRDLVREHAPRTARLSPAGFESNHAAISAAAIERWRGRPDSCEGVTAAVHHGSAARGYSADTSEVCGGEAWARERRRLIEAILREFPPTADPEPPPGACTPLLAGLVTVADWIGSDERHFPADGPPRHGDAAATAEQALSECGLVAPALRPDLSFLEVFKVPPYPSQQEFIDRVTCPGLHVLEAPMGAGKTEAALYAAYRLIVSGHSQGIYFALPTRLTSDRIHERMGKFLDAVSVTAASPLLAHGLAWMRAFESRGGRFSPHGGDWFGPLKRALLAPYGVGTIDQALLAVLRVRHNFVRTYGLAGKVIILDEVHSYDLYTGTLLDRLVERLLGIGCTVIVLSATLTAARRGSLDPTLLPVSQNAYPLLISSSGGLVGAHPLSAPPDRECTVRIEDWDDGRVARAASDAARAGQCVLCIANTVGRAQSWYQAVVAERAAGEFEAGLLHSRFPVFRREELEARWVAWLGKSGPRPRGSVLVATQVVEQSVDLDADLLVTELAPTDMLLQRMGRLWRHPRNDRPAKEALFLVVTRDPAGATTAEDVERLLGRENCRVYSPYVLMRTFEVWRGVNRIAIPGDIRSFIERTYTAAEPGQASLMEDLSVRLAHASRRLRSLAEAAGDIVHWLPVADDREESAPTRYSDYPTVAILPVEGVSAPSPMVADLRLLGGQTLRVEEFRRSVSDTLLLHRSLVRVARHLLPRGSAGRQEKRWLRSHFHDPPFVLIRDPSDGTLTLDGRATVLGYRDDLGIFRTDGSRGVTGGEYLDEVSDFDPIDARDFDW
jgi:CRISPR-associated endonuclease/helicase Cas3